VLDSRGPNPVVQDVEAGAAGVGREPADMTAAHLAAIVESADDAIISKDLDGVIQTWNQGAERIFGYTADEVVGRSILVIIPEDRADEEPRILEQIRSGARVDHFETVRRAKDGRDLQVSITVSPLKDGEGRVVGASKILRDITRHRAMEEHLQMAAKMEAIGRLAGGIAHDFNNQLQALRGFADLVAMDAGLGPRAREDLSNLRKSAERMGSLTRQLLAFSRQQIVSLEPVDLNAAVKETRPMLQRLIGAHIDLRLELGGGAAWVKADRAQLDQVFLNLAINARDALPNGGEIVFRTRRREVGEDDLAIFSGGIAPGAYVELRVHDDGLGIPADVLPHVFEPFFTTKGPGRGTGLGLSTVHGIVTQGEGAIWAESEAGLGTTFVLLFPAVGGAAGVEDEPVEASGSTRGRRILVVEDEEFVRRFMVRALELAGYEVLEAGHGREALERLGARGDVDLVISDVIMPVMGGVELSAELRRRYPGLDVLFMSGYAHDSTFASGTEGPFLQKPVAVDRLLGTVEELLAARAARLSSGGR
jgi:PAS domain S-box-containing protein